MNSLVCNAFCWIVDKRQATINLEHLKHRGFGDIEHHVPVAENFYVITIDRQSVVWPVAHIAPVPDLIFDFEFFYRIYTAADTLDSSDFKVLFEC